MITNRRALLSTGAVAALLAGCGGVTPGPSPTPLVPPEVLDDVTLVLSSLENLLPELTRFVPANLIPQVQAYLAQARQLVTEIGSVTTGTSLQSKIQAFVQVVRQVLATLQSAGLAIPAEVGTILTAVQVLLPIILAAAGIFSAQAARPGEAERARAVLRGVARRR